MKTIFSLTILFIAAFYIYYSSQELTIEIEIETLDPAADKIIMYCDSGSGFSSKRSFSGYYTKAFETKSNVYHFSYNVNCPGNVTHIRLDPVNNQGTINIKNISLVSFFKKELNLKKLFNDTIRPLHNINRLSYRETEGDIVVISKQSDPHLLLIDEQTIRSRHYVSAISALTTLAKLIAPLFLIIYFVSILTTKSTKIHPHKNSYSLLYLFLLSGLCVASTALTIYIQYSNPFSHYLSTFISSTTNLFAILSIILIVSVYFSHIKIIRYFFDISALFTAMYFFCDSLLFSLNGMHLNYGIGIITSNGVHKILESLTYTGISKNVLSIYIATIAIGFILLAIAVWKLNFSTRKYHLRLRLRDLSMVAVICLIIFVLEVQVLSKQKNQRLVFDDTKNLLSYVVLREVDPGFKTKAIDIKEPSPTGPITFRNRKNIFIFVLESVRSNAITAESSPNILNFSNDCIPINKTYANGNATHYGWYSIFNSKHPLFWEKTRNTKNYPGAYPLRVFKNNGYKISIFTAKDLRYLGAHKTLFGSDLQPTELDSSDSILIDHITDRPKSHNFGAYELDKYVTDELIRHTQNNTHPQPSLNIIYYDAVHFPYRWDPAMPAPITPYVGEANGDISLFMGRKIASDDKPLIYNRYLNSVRYDDLQFGRVIKHLKSTGQYDDSIIILVSDHGQQFLEHNFLMHGATLYDEDVSIPMYIKPAQTDPMFFQKLKLASQVDLMPTLFGLLGVESKELTGFIGNDLLNTTISECNGELTTVAGKQNTPYIHALITENFKLLFNINSNAPLNSKKSNFMDIVDETDNIVSPSNIEEYSRITRELETIWNCLPEIDLLFGTQQPPAKD